MCESCMFSINLVEINHNFCEIYTRVKSAFKTQPATNRETG